MSSNLNVIAYLREGLGVRCLSWMLVVVVGKCHPCWVWMSKMDIVGMAKCRCERENVQEACRMLRRLLARELRWIVHS